MFQEMIFAAVAADFEFGPQAIGGALFFGEATAFQNAMDVAVKVESPLIEVAGGDGDEAGAGGRHGDGIECGWLMVDIDFDLIGCCVVCRPHAASLRFSV